MKPRRVSTVLSIPTSSVYCNIIWLSRSSLAEFKQELFKDEDGSSGAEYDEGLTAEETEHRASQSCSQETPHHTLLEGKDKRGVRRINILLEDRRNYTR